MTSVNFGDCVSNYWFLWAIDGLGSIVSLLMSVAVAFFFLKYFQNIAHGSSKPPTKPDSEFDNFPSSTQADGIPVGSWGDSNTMGNVFNPNAS